MGAHTGGSWSDIGRSVWAMARGAVRERWGRRTRTPRDAVQETRWCATHRKRQPWAPSSRSRLGWAIATPEQGVDALRRRGRRKAEPLENFEEFCPRRRPRIRDALA